jgi:malate permease and related proteins
MELALITVKQVVVLFILIFAGFVCVKTKAVKMEGKKAFSDLLLYLIVPAMVINSYMMEFNIDILHNLLKAFELSILLLLIGLFITLALTAKHKSPDLPIMRFACIFSNAAYMGFPLCQVIRSDTKKINFFCQLITNYNCRRSFNHDALLRCVVFNTLPV